MRLGLRPGGGGEARQAESKYRREPSLHSQHPMPVMAICHSAACRANTSRPPAANSARCCRTPVRRRRRRPGAGRAAVASSSRTSRATAGAGRRRCAPPARPGRPTRRRGHHGHQAAAGRQLRRIDVRDGRHRALDDDGVPGPAARQPGGQAPVHQAHRRRHAGQHAQRDGHQRVVLLQRGHLRRRRRRRWPRRSRCRRHHQHAVAGPHPGHLHQPRDHQRLHQHAAVAERQILVDIGQRRQSGRQELLPRQAAHGVQHARVRHPVGPDLAVDHVVAGGREIGLRLVHARSEIQVRCIGCGSPAPATGQCRASGAGDAPA